jgi:hypothetical protein
LSDYLSNSSIDRQHQNKCLFGEYEEIFSKLFSYCHFNPSIMKQYWPDRKFRPPKHNFKARPKSRFFPLSGRLAGCERAANPVRFVRLEDDGAVGVQRRPAVLHSR